MQQIKCEHPVIIENPYLKQLVCKYQKVWLKDHWLNLSAVDKVMPEDITVKCHDGRGNERTRTERVDRVTSVSRNRHIWSDWNATYHKFFWKTRTGVSLDTIDDYYIVTPDGEMIPVYLPVPCGKCSLCREKKARDWQTRCLAETAMSDYPPLFITLTYRNEDLPADGVCKKDCQKFLKRLRIHIERHLGKKCRLRYVLVSEYGKTTHRAHYHMLLWNMPFVSDEGKNTWQALHDFIQRSWTHGWIGLERCVDYSGKYCMKYLRKECVVPAGCNATFLLSSRRGGIGRAYADSLTEFARNNPQMPSITILNKFDGSNTRCAVPDYFKRIWFPSLSGIVKQEIRDEVSNFMELARMMAYTLIKFKHFSSCGWRNDIRLNFDARLESRIDEVLDMENDIEERFPFCVENWSDITPERLHRKTIDSVVDPIVYDRIFDRGEEFFTGEWYTTLSESLNASYKKLKMYHPDKERIQYLLDLHVTHTALMLELALKCDPINIEDEVARVARDNARLERGVRSDECLHETSQEE